MELGISITIWLQNAFHIHGIQINKSVIFSLFYKIFK